MIDVILNIISGLFIGMANVIPGVSGGTIAVICGVYPRLLKVSSLNLSEIKKDWKNILALIFGMFLGLLIFAKVINFFYENYPVYISFFFVGIILGSIPFLFGLIKTKQAVNSSMPIKFIAFIFGLSIMLVLFFGKMKLGDIQNEVITTISVKIFIWLFFLGLVSAIAMLIPGISGSFLLLVLGGYATVIYSVAHLNFIFILPYFLGVVFGLVIASKLLSSAIKKIPQIIYSFIFGLVIGSVFPVVPITPQTGIGYLISGSVAIIGIIIVIVFTYFGVNKTKGENN